jgi:polyhydroxyalkanoate synthesis regulator protein
VATPILIKRYARSQLYDAVNGGYVTVAQLRVARQSGWEDGDDQECILTVVAD